jgi:hypothetical protein
MKLWIEPITTFLVSIFIMAMLGYEADKAIAGLQQDKEVLENKLESLNECQISITRTIE